MKRLALILMVVALGTLSGLRTLDRWIEETELPVTLTETSVEMRDRTGQLLRAYPVDNGVLRLRVTADQVDPDFIAMLLRYEDRRFRTHTGVDPIALMRAAGQALWNGKVVSGGSTLTMQVARLLEDGSTGRWAGKMRQIRVALALERRLDKDQILSLYLTHAPYGGNLEGIRSATLAWFGKEPRRLTPAQAALLVALPQSPESRRPDRAADRALQARNVVLARMERQGIVTAEESEAARRTGVPRTMHPFPRLAPHLADHLRKQDHMSGRFDLTLDAGLQAKLQHMARQAASEAGRRVSVAILVADHASGDILASVGSPDYRDGSRQGFVDMTRAVRSPGSTLKPLVYGLAFDQGLAHPETLIHDGPVDFDGYAPVNFDREFRGDVRVRDALQLSLNIPVVKLTDALGPVRVMDGLRRSGAEPRLPGGAPGLAIALGGIGVTLRDLVQHYAVLAQGGQGAMLSENSTGKRRMSGRVISPEAAWQVANILQGLAPPPGGPMRKLAYKTGTSYGHRDAWAIGFDGRHVVGIWLGRADGTPVPGAFGGELAAPILFEVFGRIKPGFAPLPAPPPATLIVSSAELPQPLQRFRARNAAYSEPETRPKLMFPPDGAQLASRGGALTVKLHGGQAPFAVLANGIPVRTGVREREFDIPNPGAGFSTLVVVDGSGRSDRAVIRVMQ